MRTTWCFVCREFDRADGEALSFQPVFHRQRMIAPYARRKMGKEGGIGNRAPTGVFVPGGVPSARSLLTLLRPRFIGRNGYKFSQENPQP